MKKYPVYHDSEGNVIPGLTTILSVISKGPGLENWLMKNGENAKLIKQEAADYGDRIHALVEAYIQGQKMHLAGKEKTIINNFHKLVDTLVDKWLFTEKKVSSKIGFGGTVDCAFLGKDGLRYLADIKTSSNLYAEFNYQLAGYRQALREEKEEFDKVVIFHLDKDSATWQHVFVDTESVKNDVTPLDVVKAALVIWKHKR